MNLKGKKIGFAITGSFCNFKNTIQKMKEIISQGAKIIPIMSFNAYNLDTRFGKSQDFIDTIEEMTENKIIHTMDIAEQIRTEEYGRYYDYCSLYRKYYCKIGEWNL